MLYNLNFNELLKEYDENDYVYVVERCMDYYVTKTEPSPHYCEACGCNDVIIAKDYVYNLINTKFEGIDIPKITYPVKQKIKK